MSQRTVNNPRARSSSRKPQRAVSAADSPKYSSISRSRVPVSVKIEERLMNQQITYKRRLEHLKKTYEEEELKEVQSKPKISSKSRSLAQKAEQRMLEQYHYLKNPVIEPERPVQVQPEYTARSASASKPAKVLNQNLNQSHLFAVPAEKTEKVRTKSLLNLSVLERNQTWLEEKETKIGLKRKEIEEKDLAECTFSPKTQNKIRHSRSMRENGNTSYISSPGTVDISELNEIYSRGRPHHFGYRPIAPYQVKVAFKCGIDLNSFLRRAK
jgi:hypothetical protein